MDRAQPVRARNRPRKLRLLPLPHMALYRSRVARCYESDDADSATLTQYLDDIVARPQGRARPRTALRQDAVPPRRPVLLRSREQGDAQERIHALRRRRHGRRHEAQG
jgi:hypothetical protein